MEFIKWCGRTFMIWLNNLISDLSTQLLERSFFVKIIPFSFRFRSSSWTRPVLGFSTKDNVFRVPLDPNPHDVWIPLLLCPSSQISTDFQSISKLLTEIGECNVESPSDMTFLEFYQLK